MKAGYLTIDFVEMARREEIAQCCRPSKNPSKCLQTIHGSMNILIDVQHPVDDM